LVACAAAVAVVVAGSGGRHHVARATAAGRAPPGRPHHGHARRPALPQAPAQVRGAAAERMHIPILMYHVVGTPKPGTPYPQLWVTPATFAAEMAALRRAGYYAVTVKQAVDAWRGGGALPRHPIVVSFDDGYLGDYTHARPVLQKMG